MRRAPETARSKGTGVGRACTKCGVIADSIIGIQSRAAVAPRRPDAREDLERLVRHRRRGCFEETRGGIEIPGPVARSPRGQLQIGAPSCEIPKSGAPSGLIPNLFAWQVTQIGTKLDRLNRLFLHGMVDSIGDGIRLLLSKGFFEHVAEGFHIRFVLEVCPIVVRQR